VSVFKRPCLRRFQKNFSPINEISISKPLCDILLKFYFAQALRENQRQVASESQEISRPYKLPPTKQGTRNVIR